MRLVLQVYEDTSGLTVGDTVIRSGKVCWRASHTMGQRMSARPLRRGKCPF